jgi:hypothetical protein
MDGLISAVSLLATLVASGAARPSLAAEVAMHAPSSSASHAVATVAARSASEVLCGDTNDDSKVLAGDALAALRSAVGSAACMLAACDYSGDGQITASDALSILRTAVGQSVPASCPPASNVEFEWDDGVWGQVLWN